MKFGVIVFYLQKNAWIVVTYFTLKMHLHFGQKTINLLHSSLKQKLIKIWKKCIYLNFENNTQNMIESVQYFQIKTAEDK